MGMLQQRLTLTIGCIFTVIVSCTSRATFGAIRWDAWNGKTRDIISETVGQTMLPGKYHWRLPWYADIDNTTGVVSFDADRQEIMDQELEMAHEAGIKFFAYDTYCVWPTDSGAKEGHLCNAWWNEESVGYKARNPAYGLHLHQNSTKKSLVNISLVLLGASPASPAMRPRYLSLFKDASFHRVLGDRPLVFLFNAGEEEAQIIGSWEAWRAQWDVFRNESIAQGTGNPYFVALTVGTGNFLKAVDLRQKLGFDAVGAYALPGGTLQGVPFSEQRATATAFWEAAKKAGVPLVPPVPTGWDPRPRADHKPVWVNETGEHFITPEPAELTDLFQDAQAFIRKNQEVVPTETALVYAWNENTEGGWLLPTKGEGRSRLEAVSKALLG